MQLNLADALGTDFQITYESESEIVQASLVDDTDLGVFKVIITLTKTGQYSLEILIVGLEVPTYLTQLIEVIPKPVTSPETTGFTGTLVSYLTGESVELLITSRDEFTNLRGSTDDLYKLYLTG